MDELHKSIKADAITPDLYAFLQYAQTALMSSQSSAQLLDFFSFDEQGNPNFNLNNPLTEPKFKQMCVKIQEKHGIDNLTDAVYMAVSNECKDL
ncbi:MAG TPA: hypothetical protein DCX27_18570 [Balneola sp.]|nr:hypothetical protein [Balneola sp.]